MFYGMLVALQEATLACQSKLSPLLISWACPPYLVPSLSTSLSSPPTSLITSHWLTADTGSCYWLLHTGSCYWLLLHHWQLRPPPSMDLCQPPAYWLLLRHWPSSPVNWLVFGRPAPLPAPASNHWPAPASRQSLDSCDHCLTKKKNKQEVY